MGGVCVCVYALTGYGDGSVADSTVIYIHTAYFMHSPEYLYSQHLLNLITLLFQSNDIYDRS